MADDKVYVNGVAYRKHPESVVIDGVRYVPATEVSADAKAVMRAIAATYMGWDKKYLDDPKTYKILYLCVNEDGEGESLEDFMATLAMAPPEK